MKMKKMRTVTLAAMIMLVAALFSACGGAGTKEATGGAGNKEEVSKEPVDITFYRPHTGTTEEQFMDLMGNKIKEKFPNVNLKFIPDTDGSHMEDVLATGQDLDVLILSIGFVPSYPNYGLQFDHNDLIKKYNFDLNRLEPTMVNFMKSFGDGKMYALPIFTTAAVLMYNKELFDKFGVTYPKNGMTWDETYDLAKKMSRTDGGTQYYGFGTSIGHMFRVNQLSLPFTDAKTLQPMIANDNYRKLVDNFARFYRIPGYEFDSKQLKKPGDMFIKTQNLAMYAYFNSTMVGAPEGLNLDAVTLPSFKEKPGTGSQMYATYAGVTSISKHKDMAFKVLSFLTSDEMQTKFAKDGLGLPVVKNDKIIDVFGENVPTLKGKHVTNFYPQKPAEIAPKTEYDDLVEKRLGTAFNDVALGKKDSVTALREAAEVASKDIESAKAK